MCSVLVPIIIIPKHYNITRLILIVFICSYCPSVKPAMHLVQLERWKELELYQREVLLP